MNSGLQAAAGFIFWIISAHLFSVANVGLATSLVSAAVVIAFVALLGFNSTIVRYLPRSSDRNVFITSALTIVAVCAAVFSSFYVLIIPLIAPRLAFVTHHPLLALGFILLTTIGALTSSPILFSSACDKQVQRPGRWGIRRSYEIVASLVVAGAGAYGLFLAASVGYAIAAIASLILLATANHFHPSLRGAFQVLKPLLRFSGANYLGNILTQLPTFVVPLIVLDRVGAHDAAYYFIAYQVVSLLYAAVFAVEQTFLAEGSHEDVDLHQIMRRSWRLLAAFCVPASPATRRQRPLAPAVVRSEL